MSGPGYLTPPLELLVRATLALAARDEERLARSFRAAADRVSPEAMEEALLQSYLFVGYPLALNALGLWRRTSGRAAPPARDEEWGEWEARGKRVCRIVYGRQYDALRRNVRRLHPDLERWMVVEGYGKVLGREGLSLEERELLIVALLAVLRTPVQLYSHLRGALAAGAGPDQVERVLELAGEVTDEAGRSEARKVWERVRNRVRGSDGEDGDDG